MARVALILKYQWRAYWRRFSRTRHRVQFYLTMLAVLGWSFIVVMPAHLSRAAHELAAGETTSMESVLWAFCVLWLLVVVEDTSVSLTSRHLLTFPIDLRSLLGVRMLSLFCSPVALLIALGSLVGLWPLFAARHTVLGSLAALLLYALTLGVGMSVSHVLSVPHLRRTLLIPAAIVSICIGVLFFAQELPNLEQLRAALALTPPRLVTAVAVAATPSAALIPLSTLLAISALVGYLLGWSFRRSLFSPKARHATARTADSVLWFPGRFGGLWRKEQHYFRKVLDLWLGLLLVLAISIESLFGSPPPIVRQSIILIVFALNVNVMMNCFGADSGAELNRYFILPLRGKDVLLVKNLGLTTIVAAQLALLVLTAAWRSGFEEAGTEIVLAAILLLSHLAWGNLVSVAAPFTMQFYRFASSDAPLTALFGMTIGSAPGVMVLFLLHSGSPFAAPAIALTLVLVTIAYLVSLHNAGKSFEQRRNIIAERLS